MTNCLTCNTPTSNPKYCSRSCSAVASNKAVPRRKPEGNCVTCLEPIKSSRTYCKLCFQQTQIDWSAVSYADISGKRAYQKHSRIRDLARRAIKQSGQSMTCVVCGYDKHVEVCHIKAISKYSIDTKISEINHPDNLVLLCPNHHWELDYGDLVLPSQVSPTLTTYTN